MSSLFSIVLLAGLAWFWLDTLRVREIAKGLCQQLCRHHGLQWLDSSIAFKRLRVVRNFPSSKQTNASHWQWQLQRTYIFEFSADQEDRQQGTVMMNGMNPVFINIPGYYERVIERPE